MMLLQYASKALTTNRGRQDGKSAYSGETDTETVNVFEMAEGRGAGTRRRLAARR